MTNKSIVYYRYDVDSKQFENQTSSNYCFYEYREIDIKASKKASKEFFKPNDVIDYTITLTNQGTYKATNLIITDTITDQSLIGEVDIFSPFEHKFTYKIDKDNLIIEIDSLNEKETLHICYTVRVSENIELPTNFITQIQGKSDDEYLFTSNELKIYQRYAKVICNKKMSSIIYPNREFETTITITNVGNEIAKNINVFEYLIERFSLSKILIDNEETNDYTLDQAYLTIKISELKPNETKTISIYGLLKK